MQFVWNQIDNRNMFQMYIIIPFLLAQFTRFVQIASRATATGSEVIFINGQSKENRKKNITNFQKATYRYGENAAFHNSFESIVSLVGLFRLSDNLKNEPKLTGTENEWNNENWNSGKRHFHDTVRYWANWKQQQNVKKKN